MDTGCSRSIGSLQAINAYLEVDKDYTCRVETRVSSSRPYGVGGGGSVTLPAHLGDRPCTVTFEAGEFGMQPLLLGTNAAYELGLDIKLRKNYVKA